MKGGSDEDQRGGGDQDEQDGTGDGSQSGTAMVSSAASGAGSLSRQPVDSESQTAAQVQVDQSRRSKNGHLFLRKPSSSSSLGTSGVGSSKTRSLFQFGSFGNNSRNALKQGASLFERAMETVKSPQSTSSNKTSAKPPAGSMPMSPSGKTVRSLVNRLVSGSPFRFQSPKRKAQTKIDGDATVESAKRRQSGHVVGQDGPHQSRHMRKRRRLDFYDKPSAASVGTTGHAFTSTANARNRPSTRTRIVDCEKGTIMDWCLREKFKLVFQCTAPHWTVPPLLEKHLQSWQFPSSTTPQPRPTRAPEEARTSTSSTGKSASSSSTSKRNKLRTAKTDGKLPSADGHRGDARKSAGMHHNQKAKRKMDQSHLSTFRWQQAFRSVYINWVRSLHHYQSGANQASHERGALWPVPPEDCYLYCVAIDHTVLFRYSGSSSCSYNTTRRPHAVSEGRVATPNIVMVGATTGFVDTLKRLGAVVHQDDLHDIEMDRDEEDCVDDAIDDDASNSVGNSAIPRGLASPNTKAELEGLRRAQVLGLTAGADVSFRSDHRHQASSKHRGSAANAAALGMITVDENEDSIAIFAETYMNTYGSSGQLPIIVSTTPFLHATSEQMEMVACSNLHREDPTTKLLEYGAGYLLPRALQGMTEELMDHIRHQQSQDVHDNNGDQNDNGRNMIAKNLRHPMDEDGRLSPKFSFKLGKPMLETPGFNNGEATCPKGKVVDIIKWQHSDRGNVCLKFGEGYE